jgi:hypothetical protein
VNLSCPLEKGYRELVQQVELPSEIPEGKYTVTADAYTENHEREITCLKGEITF